MTVASAELLEVAVRAARAGGAVLIAGRERPKEVELKSERASIVTWADLTSQAEIFATIGAAYPDHAIMGEEGDGGGDDASYVWIVDPLDGTSNYAAGLPFACVSVAVRDTDGVAAGAVFDPFHGELFSGTRGGHAWLDTDDGRHTRLRVSDNDALSGALVATGLQSDDPEAMAAHGRRISALHGHTRGSRGLGSPALCHAYVAAGRLDAFFERGGTWAWDVAAGSLLIAEAGGLCEDLDGGPVNLGRGVANVLATNGRIHDDLRELIARTDGVRGLV